MGWDGLGEEGEEGGERGEEEDPWHTFSHGGVYFPHYVPRKLRD